MEIKLIIHKGFAGDRWQEKRAGFLFLLFLLKFPDRTFHHFRITLTNYTLFSRL